MPGHGTGMTRKRFEQCHVVHAKNIVWYSLSEITVIITSMFPKSDKPVYICGPLTELAPDAQERVKHFYQAIADVFEKYTGIRAFVPHEHYDPVKHAGFTPQEVDAAERAQVCEKSSALVVVAIEPSWGGGIEVEMAHQSNIPVFILCERKKLEERKISRLLRGNPAVVQIITYDSEADALKQLGALISAD